ncbi:MAG TPA: protein kinase [Gemmatimonadaceae bacterium]|nr:protein kinase [Gemmatimonadaceae bacterium]
MTQIPPSLLSELEKMYEIERELVGGGMAQVLVARDRALERRVVVKVLPTDLAAGVSAERFRREILTVAQLQHPHIVTVLSTGEIHGIPYFVMPFVEGESLADHMKHSGRMNVSETVAIVKDVARALAFAHDRGVVHRDIKPGNILLAAGSATVTDFGVAKALSTAARNVRPAGRNLTDTGISLGTVMYMAPEQAAGDPDIDGRADIYSLGVTAYEMLTGAPPFADLGPRDLLASRLTKAPPPVDLIRKDVPESLADLIEACLEPDPARRPQKASEVIAWLDQTGVSAGSIRISGGITRRARARRRMMRIAGSAGIGAAMVIGGIVYATRAGRTTEKAAADITALTPAPRMVVVMPFVAMREGRENGYLAAGLTDALAVKLSRAAGLRVITPTRSTDYVKGAQASNVSTRNDGFVLEGTVERNGQQFRAMIRLSQVVDGAMLWAEVYDRDLKDLHTVEDDIARSIVEVIAPAAVTRLDSFERSAPKIAPAVYQTYLRARFDMESRTRIGLQRAVAAFREVTRQAPTFAPAFASLSEAYAILPLYSATYNDSLKNLAYASAQQAISLDPRLAEAYTARGLASSVAWQWGQAERDFQKSLSLDSLSARTHQWHGEHLLVTGNARGAVAELTRAARLDPSSSIIAGSLALAIAHSGDAKAAIAQAQRAIAMDPGSPTINFMYGAVLLYSGKAAEATAALEESTGLAPGVPIPLGLLGYAYALTGDTVRARRILDEVERMPKAFGKEPAIARIRAALGDDAGAIAALERAAALHDPFFSNEPLSSPPFARLRNNPGFQLIAARVGLRS